MRYGSVRRLGLAVVALLVLSAGCQSLGGTAPATETDGSGTGATVTEEPAAPEPNQTTDNGSDGSVQSPFDAHEQTLRDAGNVTVEWASTTRYPDSDVVGRSTDSSYRIDFDSGRAIRIATQARTDISGPAQTSYTYRNETGSLFAKYSLQSAPSIDVNVTVSPLRANESQLVYRGEETVDGVNGSVYTLGSYGGLESEWYADPDNVIEFDVTYVVDEAGYVAYQRVNVTRDWDGETVITRDRRWFESVGSTTVTRPNWADEPVGNRTATAPSRVAGH